jgi:hypothetical protein
MRVRGDRYRAACGKFPVTLQACPHPLHLISGGVVGELLQDARLALLVVVEMEVGIPAAVQEA